MLNRIKTGLAPHLPAEPYRDWLKTAVVFVSTLVLVRFLLHYVLHLPTGEALYENGYLLWNSLAETSPRRLVLLTGLLVGCVYLDVGRKFRPLTAFGKIGRALLWMAILIQVYSVGLMDYNHYYDQWYWLDRTLLIALGGLAMVRPAYLPLFILQLSLLTGQLRHPDIIGYDHVHKFIVVPILGIFWTYGALSTVLRPRRGWVLPVIMVMSILSLWYINAGLGKIQIDWQDQNSLYFLFAAAVDTGWLGSWSMETKRALGNFLIEWQTPLLWSTIVVEILLPLLLFHNRWTAAVASVSLMLFHLAVYLFSGILFWQWSLLELVFLYWVVFRPQEAQAMFSWRNRVVYVVSLLTLPWLVHIGKLAWYDCGFTNRYHFYLVDEAGREQELDATYFSPYDTGFAKNRFYYTTPFKTLAFTYGQCDEPNLLQTAYAYGRQPDAADLTIFEQLRTERGMERFDAEKTARFRRFLTDFIGSKNRYDPELISHFASPPHMQQGLDQRNLTVENLSHLRVVMREKAILPGLRYVPLRQDSFFLSFDQPTPQ